MSTPTHPASVTPFTINIPDDRLGRLKRKLEDTEVPDDDLFTSEGGAGWDYGVPLEWVKEMKRYWIDDFDWRAVEATINKFHHYKVIIEGVSIHFIHQRSEDPNAIPIIMSHGWPGSFFEFCDIIEPLVSPISGEQAFHVVVPSLPGFGFSSPPPKKEWTVKDTARVFDILMTEVLSYKSYMAQGGDWGSQISNFLSDYPACKAVHINTCQVPPPVPYPVFGAIYMLMPKFASDKFFRWYFSPDEYRSVVRSIEMVKRGCGYFAVQATQPLTVGYALNDNPLGLLIWIGEKYKTLTDDPLPPSTLLATISLYYHSHSFYTSCLPYYENQKVLSGPPFRITSALLGVSTFPKDVFVLPKHWVSKWVRDKLVFHRAHESGGHFPALECPDVLAGDLREFIGPHRALFA